MTDQAQEAYTVARIVGAQLESHEKVCSERYGEIKTSISRIHKRLDWLLTGVIGILLTILGYVVTNWAPWAHPGTGG